jgi:hypothetical protein
LSPVTIIGGIKEDDLVTFINQTHNGAVQALDSTIDGADFCLRVQVWESLFVVVSNSFNIVQRSESSGVLVAGYIKI